MSALGFLFKRYLLPRQGNLLSLGLYIATAGVAVGVIQLMLVLGVMSGFQNFLQKSYTKITSELVVVPKANESGAAIANELKKIPGIRAITPFNFSQGMLIKNGVAGVILEGVEFESSKRVTPWEEVWTIRPNWDLEPGARWIWIGVQLAKKLGAKPGDTVHLFLPGGNQKSIPFIVTGITKFGIYDHDLRYARVDLKVLNEIFQSTKNEPMFKCALVPGASLSEVAERVREHFDRRASVKLWSDVNKNLFQAVQHQKLLLFLILEVLVALAGMNVANLLLMSSHQRKRDVAIWRALGMRERQVFIFFVFQGAAVGIAGIVSGTLLGYFMCQAVEMFQPSLLNESVYNIAKLPVMVGWSDVALISVVALILCIALSVFPAIRAARARPVEALRYE